MARGRTLAVLMAAVLVGGTGCGGSSSPADAGMGTDAMTPADAGGADAGGADAGAADAGSMDGATSEAGPTADGNDSFATATPIMIDDSSPTSGAIDPAGDLDYYSFTGAAGQWIGIFTQANPMDDPTKVDTVLTLYDASMTQIAENDDAIPRVSTDSEIITRLPADGTYYVLAQEWSTWDGTGAAKGDPSFTYDIRILSLDGSGPVVTVDPETGDDVASAAAVTFSMNTQIVLGTLRDTSDVDVYTITVPAGSTQILDAALLPEGPMGDGSTTHVGHAWITDMAGSTIIARIDPTAGPFQLVPSLDPGTYQLFVDDPGGAAGANDFYVLKLALAAENPVEMMEVANDTLSTAEPLMLNDVTGMTGVQQGPILSHLGMGDTDHFSFTVADNMDVSLACGSAREGSGVHGLTVDLLDSTGTSLVSRTETLTDDLFVNNQHITTGGTYYLRLTEASQDATVTGDWVRCGVYVTPPSP